MATNLALYNIRYDTINSAGDTPIETLRKRATTAVALAAVVILSESGATVNHAARLIWAKSALANGEATKATAQSMLWSLLSDTTVQSGGITDNALNTLVAGFVDTYAG